MRRLRILHICYDGSWIHPLLHELEKRADIMRINPSKKERTKVRMTESIAAVYRERIDQFQPDVIHVHGTENNLGQLQHFYPDIPVVVSIQGVLTGCIPYSTGGLTRKDIIPFTTLKNVLRQGGLMGFHRRISYGSRTFEKDILSSCRFFFCRTEWDREWVKIYNPQAVIYQGEELLRPAFYEKAGLWNERSATPHTIFMPSGFNPIKGLHHAITAVSLLVKDFPDVKLRVPGIPANIYNRTGLVYRLVGEEYLGYVRHLIEKLGVSENVEFLPHLSAEEMASEMLRANVFISPSSIDNSPNAVGEAMMLGLPIVCTPVGGVPSFVHHEKNGLLTEPAGLADAIRRIFDDTVLAGQLGANAYTTALRRHDKEQVAEQYMTAYRDIVEKCEK